MSAATGQSEMAEFLKQRGWRELPVRHEWKWRKNLPGQYTLRDAYSLEKARSRGKKKGRNDR
jgi:hypothetical protein